MPQEKHKSEQIVAKRRQVDVLVSRGRSVAADANRKSGRRRCADPMDRTA